MRPPKKPWPRLMVPLRIAVISLLANNAFAFSQAVPYLSAGCGSRYSAKLNAQDYYAGTLQRLGIVVYRNWERPRRACSEKLAHLPVPRPLDQAVAPQPLAFVPHARLTLARGMTFKKLLRRRSIG
ncbi:hypothetical protein [Pseudomonas tolaasii]|nr:hypothetical protein [Pseudomonas tolaasii]PKA73444.1 hypothetical protein ATI14_0159 [Pseudomonas tolaasii NCPPB 2192]WLH50948.1 hypothetical protein PSH62_23120 [Pseudomonas tolaasii]